jgi:hypothetical protein
MATFLKDPPVFVTNIGAWEYVLAKLATLDEDKPKDKPRLDEGGNPTNYGQAVAIYKAVCKKYPAFQTTNAEDVPVRLGGMKMHEDALTVTGLDEHYPVGQMFWYDDVLCEAVGHPNIAVYSDPDGKLFIRGRVQDVDPLGAHKAWPIGREAGFPPHRCAPGLSA